MKKIGTLELAKKYEKIFDSLNRKHCKKEKMKKFLGMMYKEKKNSHTILVLKSNCLLITLLV